MSEERTRNPKGIPSEDVVAEVNSRMRQLWLDASALEDAVHDYDFPEKIMVRGRIVTKKAVMEAFNRIRDDIRQIEHYIGCV